MIPYRSTGQAYVIGVMGCDFRPSPPLDSRLCGNDDGGGGSRTAPTFLPVYEPPASRYARRVPLLLTQKGEG